MTRVGVGVMVAAMAWATSGSTVAQVSRVVEVYKSPTCGCCTKWVEHLEKSGFQAKATNVADLEQIRARNHVPPQLSSCHTALVSGYVIEGHVPASDIRRLLKERPAGVIGLAAPGMPIGSPGMETPGVAAQAYDVIAFDKAGRTRVFATHGR